MYFVANNYLKKLSILYVCIEKYSLNALLNRVLLFYKMEYGPSLGINVNYGKGIKEKEKRIKYRKYGVI